MKQDKDRVGTTLDAVKEGKGFWKQGDKLYLGAHMMNDPCFDSKDGPKDGPYFNIRFNKVFEVYTIRDIKVGNELFVDYTASITNKRVNNEIIIEGTPYKKVCVVFNEP